MKKNILILFSVIFGQFFCIAANSYIIRDEINSLLENNDTINKTLNIKNVELQSLLTQLNTIDVVLQKESALSRRLSQLFYSLSGVIAKDLKGIVILSESAAPKLHAMLNELCTSYGLTKPPIFLAGDKEYFNAMASSTFTDNGMIILGRKLVEQMTDAQLRAILAHELGHIKNNHIVKKIAIACGSGITFFILLYCIDKLFTDTKNLVDPSTGTLFRVSIPSTTFFSKLIKVCSIVGGIVGINMINALASRYFEKQADIDAITITNDPASFVEAIKMLKKETLDNLEIFQNECTYIDAKIQESKELYANNPVALVLINEYATITALNAAIKREAINNLITNDSLFASHPSLDSRITYGEEMIQ